MPLLIRPLFLLPVVLAGLVVAADPARADGPAPVASEDSAPARGYERERVAPVAPDTASPASASPLPSERERAPADPAPPAFVSRAWLTDDGLPHNVVARVEQDRAGYLWVATLGGLARFDGQEFKAYAVPGGPVSRGRNVRDFTLLPDGRVLFLPAGGGVLQVQDGRVSVHPVSRELGALPLLQIYAEPGGALWLEAGQGLVRWDGARLQRFGDADGINRRSLHFSWATDGHGRTWIGGADFLGYYEGGALVRLAAPKGIVYRIAPSRAGGVWVYGDGLFTCEGDRLVRLAGPGWPKARASARSLYEDASGALWIATSRAGVFRYENGAYSRVTGAGAGVECITGDREGDIWLATDGDGLRRLRPKSFTFVDAPVKTVGVGPDGSLWFGAMDGGLIRRTGAVQQAFAVHVGRTSLHVMAAAADGSGHVWLGTTNGLFRAPASDPLRLTRVDPALRTAHGLVAAPNGDVWLIAAGRFGYYRADTADAVAAFHPATPALEPGEEVTAVAAALPLHFESQISNLKSARPAAPLLFGTSHGHLYTAGADGVLTPVRLPAAAAHAGAIHAVLRDRSALWIGAADGLFWTDGRRARRFTAAEGLPDSPVLQLLEDQNADLWLATGRGLFRVRRRDLLEVIAGTRPHVDLIAYGPDQGLLGISPITNELPAATIDARGHLWFCTYKGGISIDPTQVPHDEVPPPVLIKEVELDEQPLATAAGLRVPPGQHHLAFHFAALSFAAPERVRLRHMLDGFDADWTDTAPDRIARYAKLPPGNYRLRVIGSNGDGVLNRTGTELAFTVLPAWWQTAWFRVAAVLLFAALVGGAVRYWSHRKLKARLERLEREHALEQERARIARDMHDELGGSVTGINLAVQRLRTTPTAGDRPLDVLENRVRRLTIELDRIVWTVSPKHGSLDQLAVYLERFARNLLLESGVRCRFHGHGTMPATPVSPEVQHHVLAVTKEAVNNVLKHAHASEVMIEVGCNDGQFTLAIHDDGIGFDAQTQRYSDRNGLQNMRTRMAEIGATFVLESSPGRGTTVTLHLPLTGCSDRKSQISNFKSSPGARIANLKFQISNPLSTHRKPGT